MAFKIRYVTDEDKNAVIDIFNYYIENSFAAFFEKKVSYDVFEQMKQLAYGDAFYVIEDDDSQVIGFGLLKKFHPSEVFNHTAELGYFIRHDYTVKGLGTLLLAQLIRDAGKMNIRVLLASISSLNEKSIGFHKKHGFFECGRFEGVGQKHGQIFDLVWMQHFI